jgi:TolB-like protein
VLPFANMSRDPDDEYFSDGLADEIINALAQVPGLKVIARTSAFAFKGKNEDIRRIADTLGVTNVLEGSVRRAGGRVRVTAQLILAANGTHLSDPTDWLVPQAVVVHKGTHARRWDVLGGCTKSFWRNAPAERSTTLLLHAA